MSKTLVWKGKGEANRKREGISRCGFTIYDNQITPRIAFFVLFSDPSCFIAFVSGIYIRLGSTFGENGQSNFFFLKTKANNVLIHVNTILRIGGTDAFACHGIHFSKETTILKN